MNADLTYHENKETQARLAFLIEMLTKTDEEAAHEVRALNERIASVKQRVDERERRRKIQEFLDTFHQLSVNQIRNSVTLHVAEFHARMVTPATNASRHREVENQLAQAVRMLQYLQRQWFRLTPAQMIENLIAENRSNAVHLNIGDEATERQVGMMLHILGQGPTGIRQMKERIARLEATLTQLGGPVSPAEYQRIQDIQNDVATAAAACATVKTVWNDTRGLFMAIADDQDKAILSALENELKGDIQRAIDRRQPTLNNEQPEDQQNVQVRASMMEHHTGERNVVLSETALVDALNVTQLLTLEHTMKVTIRKNDTIPMDDDRAYACLTKIGEYAARVGIRTLTIGEGVATGAAGLSNLLRPLQMSMAIRELIFMELTIDDGGCVHLGQFIAHNKSLSKLLLSHTRLTLHGFTSISDGIRGSSTLTDMRIDNLTIDDASLIVMCNAIRDSACPFESIIIHARGFGQESMPAVGDMLKNKQTLQCLSLRGTTGARDRPLHIYTDQNTRNFEEAVRTHQSLQTLDLDTPSDLLIEYMEVHAHRRQREMEDRARRRQDDIDKFNVFQTIMLGANFSRLPRHLMTRVMKDIVHAHVDSRNNDM